MIGQTVLLIDDDTILLELLAEHLQAAGYHIVSTANGINGLSLVSEARVDLVVLDVMMPDVDGWEISQRIRTKSSIPIILLTAKSEEMDKLRGFRLGIDDYVTKPFSFAELVARVGAVLARTALSHGHTHSLISNDLAIDFAQRRVTVAERLIELTRTEYRLLETLACHVNRTVATEHLIESVWGPEYAGELEQVKHFIWTLRKKIEVDPGNPKHLITERGFGYRLE